MDYTRFFPPEVRAALSYEPPGAWMPPLPPGCIRLSAGYPFPESVPTAELVQAVTTLVAEEGDLPFRYLGSPSMDALSGQLRARSAARGMDLAPDEILITAGACDAMNLVARALLASDSVVAVEAPSYMEALEVFRNYTPYIVGYPVDGEGLQVEALEADLAGRREAGEPLPRLVYTIAAFQNPTGVSLSLPRRQRLLSLAEEYDFLILEDDAYGELAFDEALPALKALDRSGRVIHLGSLSKVIAPGLRIGWAAGPAPIITAMGCFKKDLDYSFTWSVVSRYLSGIDLGGRVSSLQRSYRERRDVLLEAMRRYLPGDVTWVEPGGGYFVWVHVPGADTAALMPKALAAGVAYVPGKYFFFASDAGKEYLRLSFSHLAPEEMVEGVARLGRVLGDRR